MMLEICPIQENLTFSDGFCIKNLRSQGSFQPFFSSSSGLQKIVSAMQGHTIEWPAIKKAGPSFSLVYTRLRPGGLRNIASFLLGALKNEKKIQYLWNQWNCIEKSFNSRSVVKYQSLGFVMILKSIKVTSFLRSLGDKKLKSKELNQIQMGLMFHKMTFVLV